MKSQYPIRTVRFALFSAVISSGFALPALAQEGKADEPQQTIVVTGSHITRTDEAALPVQVITQEDIQRTGSGNAEQFLKTVSIAVQGNSNVTAATASGANTGGVSSVSLRALGSQRTLVLINGRRVAGGGTITDSTSVDVNSIPLSALNRVDVLKDGASAIYGSDAIAGVVNFVIRDDYEGAELSGYGGGTSEGGGAVKRINGVIGFGNLADNRYNVMLAASYQKENSLFGRDRGFADSSINEAALQDGTSGNTFPANILIPDPGDPALPGVSGTTANPLVPNCAPSVVSPLFGPDRCRFDPSSRVSLLPDAERAMVYSAGHFSLNDNVQLYAEASYSRNKQNYVIQPVPISDQFNLPAGHPLFNLAPYNAGVGTGGAPSPFAFASVVLQPSSPFYPTATVQSVTGGATPSILIRYRAVDNGNRDWTDTAEQPRGVIGLKGRWMDWDFDTGFLYSETRLTEHFNSGAPLYSAILPLLNSGQVNFFGANTPDIVEQLQATNFVGDAYKTKTSIGSFAANVSRSLVDLPAGRLALALGGELRKEKFSTDPAPELQTGDVSSYGSNNKPQNQSRDVTALYAEVNVPIITNFEADFAVRYDDYENVGSKTTPKVSLRWKPTEQLLLRGSYGKGFRAPNLTELYQPQSSGVTVAGINDPARCPTTGDSNDCGTQFNILIGGSTSLKPEESDNYTLGVVWEPVTNASIGLDAFRIKLKNPIIFGIDPSAILANEAAFPTFVTRGAATGNCPGCPGPIQQIDQLNLNLGATNVDGIDADLRWRIPTAAMGTFTMGIVGTYFSKYESQLPDGSFASIVGTASFITNGAGGVIPRWHHYLSLGWNSGSWDATVAQNFQTSYRDVPGNFQDVGAPLRTVASYQTFDIQGAYNGIEHTRIAVGLRNAFDKDPPYTNAGGQSYFQAGYDPGYVDPRGRFFYGMVTYSFK